ncbi:MAG: HypC/HybG/HupF family hydrogenase formation chaperone [Betaproteobacteria bacterium]|nr:HypC/HybG/HupF family hydrogenase formation chaperone [Betaproteobacteria bacterium]
MCIGIPMKIIECNGLMAKCQGRGETRNLSLALLGEQPLGTWVLMSIDTAREVLDEETAMRINAALDGAVAAMDEPMDLTRFFPDLIGREPELPDFLKGNKS